MKSENEMGTETETKRNNETAMLWNDKKRTIELPLNKDEEENWKHRANEQKSSQKYT